MTPTVIYFNGLYEVTLAMVLPVFLHKQNGRKDVEGLKKTEG
jgi:hypothetical protein